MIIQRDTAATAASAAVCANTPQSRRKTSRNTDADSTCNVLMKGITGLLALSAFGTAAASRDLGGAWGNLTPGHKLTVRQSAGAVRHPAVPAAAPLPAAPAPAPHPHHHHHHHHAHPKTPALAPDAAHWLAPQTAPQGESAPESQG